MRWLGVHRRHGNDGARHPLRASEVLRLSGITLPTGHTAEEQLLRITCAACGLDQHLGEARLEAAGEPENISAYSCPRCGTRLLVTGHPSPMPSRGTGRHTFGDFAIQPFTDRGLRMSPP